MCDNNVCPLIAAIREEVHRALREVNSPLSPPPRGGQANLEKSRKGSNLPGLSATVTAAEADQPMKMLLSVPEAAEALSVSEGTIWALVRAGELPSCKVGRSRRLLMRGVEEYGERLCEEQAREQGDA